MDPLHFQFHPFPLFNFGDQLGFLQLQLGLNHDALPDLIAERGDGSGQFRRAFLDFCFQLVVGFLQGEFLALQMFDTPGIDARQNDTRQPGTQQIKPDGLVKVGEQTDFHGISMAIPESIGIGGNDMEGISAGLEICIKCQPPIFYEHRILIVTLKPVSKLDGFRADETWARYSRIQGRHCRVGHRRLARGQILTIDTNPTNMDPHGNLVGGNI